MDSLIDIVVDYLILIIIISLIGICACVVLWAASKHDKKLRNAMRDARKVE